jgi:hypothetical protein
MNLPGVRSRAVFRRDDPRADCLSKLAEGDSSRFWPNPSSNLTNFQIHGSLESSSELSPIALGIASCEEMIRRN